MRTRSPTDCLLGSLLAVVLALAVCCLGCTHRSNETNQLGLRVEVTFPENLRGTEAQGRLLVFLAPASDDQGATREPRFRVSSRLRGIPVYGIDVERWAPGEPAILDGAVFGFPVASLNDLEPGDYTVQAVLHRYEEFSLGNGKQISLPAEEGTGQGWGNAPGNLFSSPKRVRVTAGDQILRVELDQVVGPMAVPEDSEFIRHIKVKSARLSEFWGRDIFLGAHVLVPKDFDDHPEARFPLMVFHGHYSSDFRGFRTQPPDTDLECVPSKRFGKPCYNRVVQGEAYDFFKRWVSDDFPRFLIIVIQHANPYFDDSYAVNSANLGPYGDAIVKELIPEVERRFRGIGKGWARFAYGGSTGGWEALASQVFYPDEFNGAFAACPDPIDFRAYMTVDIYQDRNAFYYPSRFKQQLRPGWRTSTGAVEASIKDFSDLERVLGSRGRSGGQLDAWQAVYSPMGEDGYPEPIFDRNTGEIDKVVAEYWRQNYDLRFIMERDWATLGPKLEGKIHLYCGDMDTYYLNNAVYLAEDFLEGTSAPYYGGEVDYGDREGHCWNGDHENGNYISRLRYNTLYLPKILERIELTAPRDADLESWRY